MCSREAREHKKFCIYECMKKGADWREKEKKEAREQDAQDAGGFRRLAAGATGAKAEEGPVKGDTPAVG